MIVFIDFEASSLAADSWPIEIGLAWIANDGSVVSEGRLIKPHPTWSDAAWSLESAAVHGISRSLLDAAETPDVVARWMIETVGDARLVRNAPEYDQRWLDRLLATLPDPPELRIDDFDQMAWTAFTDGVSPISAPLYAVYERLALQRTVHRAAEDAANLAKAWAAGLRKRQALPE